MGLDDPNHVDPLQQISVLAQGRVARMEPTGRRKAPPDGAIRDSTRAAKFPEFAEPVIGGGVARSRDPLAPSGLRPPFPYPYSSLTLAALSIGHHFAISACCQAPSAPGVSLSAGGICNPRSSNFLRTAGSLRVSTAAVLSLATMSFGVFFGTQRPDHSVM